MPPASSTQEHLPIAGIEDGVIVMTDGSVRAVLRVDPINFELKSEEEQNGIIYSYQSFLNSLEFPVQIVIQSKKLDLERYLIKLEWTIKGMTNDLLRIQTEDYVGFVRRLISVANIMSKRFYVVVKYATAEKGGIGLGNLLHRAPKGPLLDQEQFERYRAEVYNRAGGVATGLSHIGMRVTIMGTQELIELFYGTYNPDIATEERITELDALATNLVTSEMGQQEANAAPPTSQPAVPVAQSPITPPAGSEPAQPIQTNRPPTAPPPPVTPAP